MRVSYEAVLSGNYNADCLMKECVFNAQCNPESLHIVGVTTVNI